MAAANNQVLRMGEVTEWQSRLLALGIQLRNCTGRSCGPGVVDMRLGGKLQARKEAEMTCHVTCNGIDEEEREADFMEFP